MDLALTTYFFANDSLPFCKADLTHWEQLSRILDNYEQALGQILNKEKTAIFFSRNTPLEVKEKIVEVAGIPSSQRYDTYLGLLALVGKSRVSAF